MQNIGIIGLGNPLRRDDGIGIILLDFLRKQKKKFVKNIEYIDGGTAGLNLLHHLARLDVVLLIDAVDFKAKPGESRLFTIEDIQRKKTPILLSTHESDFLKILDLSRQLNELPHRLLLFGVQPHDVSYGSGLSKELRSVLPTLQKQIMKEIITLIELL